MTFTIYALRLQGDAEVRYIGQTADTEQRLAGHISHARSMPWRTEFASWLAENECQVEIVPLRYADSREEARRIERETIALFLALDHRLFNQWLVPSDKRLPQRRTPNPLQWKYNPQMAAA